jgi:hypothetical protein
VIVGRMIESAMRSNGTVVGLKNGQRSSPELYTRPRMQGKRDALCSLVLGAGHQYRMSDGNGMGRRM